MAALPLEDEGIEAPSETEVQVVKPKDKGPGGCCEQGCASALFESESLQGGFQRFRSPNGAWHL